MSNNYTINYDDQRFQDVEADKKQAISELDKTYGEMIGQTDSFYQAQIDAAKDWEKKQTELQNQQTDFAIDKIEQQKEQAKKDYTKEQSGAYVDWQKQSNEYGANAEAEAMQGMQNTGYSESAQVSMYNTYQNRITAARESYNLAVQNYNNAITEARLQNNSALAEIAYNSLQQQLELSLQGFQYKNTLLLDKMGKKTDLENEYYARYQDVLSQINTENALAEQVRQYNEQMALEREQWEFTKAQAEARSSGGGSSRSYTPAKKSVVDDDKKGDDNKSGSAKLFTGDNAMTQQYNQTLKSNDKAATASVLKLGQGPISASNLAKQVASGKVVETKDSKGNTVFKYSGKLFK